MEQPMAVFEEVGLLYARRRCFLIDVVISIHCRLEAGRAASNHISFPEGAITSVAWTVKLLKEVFVFSEIQSEDIFQM